KSPLNILTLDTPSAYTLRSLSRLYTQKTGIPVNITIYSYDEIYEAFTNMSKDSVFDILRLDVTWLSWFAEKILQPLDGIDPSVAQCLNEFIDGTIEPFSMING
ncbi:ABC transporter substrate-binding protein, partial [Clostridioides difficile]|nr:ABC transporter substrate-binding protein [Clostridioides difficile]